MIDVHCHLACNKFLNDIDEVVSRARAAGVEKAIVVAEYPSEFERIVDLKKRFPDFVVAGIGAHPIQKKNRSVKLEAVDAVESFISSHQDQVQCVGEVGLDFTVEMYKISDEDRLVQKEVLRRQIEIAKQFDLPLNVHSRSALGETVEVLKEFGAKRVNLHAYGGHLDQVKSAADAGYYFSIPPSFMRKEEVLVWLRQIPREQILLETDSPVLGPVKGDRNEPANIHFSAEVVAKALDVSVEEAARLTSENAKRLFRL